MPTPVLEFVFVNSILNDISKFSTYGIYQDFVPSGQIKDLVPRIKKFLGHCFKIMIPCFCWYPGICLLADSVIQSSAQITIFDLNHVSKSNHQMWFKSNKSTHKFPWSVQSQITITNHYKHHETDLARSIWWRNEVDIPFIS